MHADTIVVFESQANDWQIHPDSAVLAVPAKPGVGLLVMSSPHPRHLGHHRHLPRSRGNVEPCTGVSNGQLKHSSNLASGRVNIVL